MKRYLIASLLLFIPWISMAADHCTNPKEYSVDKRCYVTLLQKAMKPYNAVVGILKPNGTKPYCTGTIVKRDDGNIYVYTAKHCIKDDSNKLHIILQTGQKMVVDFYDAGLFGRGPLIEYDGDWAIFKMNNQNVPTVSESKNFTPSSYSPFAYQAKIIGYGALKIMSDKEIQKFKEDYVKYLKNEKHLNADEIKTKEYGWRKDGISSLNQNVKTFIAKKFKDNMTFKDTDKLKVSNCTYSANGQKIGCQTWGGNSGGGIFDSGGNIMAIHTRGLGVIGGPNHAGAKDAKKLYSGQSYEQASDNININNTYGEMK